MKKIVLLVLSIFVIFISYNCKHSGSDISGLYNQNQESSSAISLLKESFKVNKSNTVISGLSVDFATTMLANGAEGKSLIQLQKFLNTTVEQKNRILQAKVNNLSKTLEISNSIWGELFNSSYQTLVENVFNASVQSLPKNTKTINSWISEKTHGKIPSVLEEKAIDPLSLYLINTVYFNDSWKDPFDKKDTADSTFHALSGQNKKVPMMSKQGSVLYARNSKFKSIKLPYKNGGYMAVLVPIANSNFENVISSLSVNDLNMDYEYVDFYINLPRFKIDNKLNIKEFFQTLGITEIFKEGNEDLTKLSIDGAYVEDIKQRAVVEVNEEGTEASAATSVSIRAKGLMSSFIVDSPFVFYISEGDFWGVYTGDEK